MQVRNEQGAGCRFAALDRQHLLGFSPSVCILILNHRLRRLAVELPLRCLAGYNQL
jgi:hypothetical protein